MKEDEKRIVKKAYRNLGKTEIIRIGNNFVDDFIFEDNKAVDIPIDALRAIFNIVADLRNEQLQPTSKPQQLSLFDNLQESKTMSKLKEMFNSGLMLNKFNESGINNVDDLNKLSEDELGELLKKICK